MYQIIYADPPWNYRDQCRAGNRGAVFKYPTMKLPQIKALPVRHISADNCVLFMWATAPMLPEGLAVIDAWGFKYKTVGFTWVKTTSKGNLAVGMGHYTRANAEFCLIGVRGSPKRVDSGVQSAIISPRRKHSQKPDEIMDRIVRLYGNVPRIELFARERVDGWDAWGNEIEPDIAFPERGGRVQMGAIKTPPGMHFRLSDLEPRKVEVAVTKFTGIGIHYHLDVVERDDLIWGFREGTWFTPSDNPYRGRGFHEKHRTHKEAMDRAQSLIAEYFGTAAYNVVWRQTQERWNYRDGD